MATVNIVLPDDLKAKAEAHAAQAGHRSLNAYLEELIREDVEREIDPALEAELLKGLAGPAAEMTSNDWNEARKQFRKRHEPAGQ